MNGFSVITFLLLTFLAFFCLVELLDDATKLRTEAINLGYAQHNPKTGIFEWKTNTLVNAEKK